MKNLKSLIKQHRESLQETWEQLNEINKIDTSKFSAKGKKEIEISILELELERSLRLVFCSELESLL